MIVGLCIGCGALFTLAPPLLGNGNGDDAAGRSMFEAPEDAATTERINRLIGDLRSPDYEERSRAVQHLSDLGPRAFRQLREAYHQTDDLELSLQIEQIVKSAYLNREVYSQHGFLGVSLYPYPYPSTARKDWETADVPEDIPAVELVRVIEDTGASRAGLKRGDVIVAVDGEPLDGAGLQLRDNFAQGISERRPGDRMVLRVFRASGAKEEIPVTLGTCPPELARRGNVKAVHERLREVSKEFDAWWSQEFRRTGTATADAKSKP